jgi:hypothetical protein
MFGRTEGNKKTIPGLGVVFFALDFLDSIIITNNKKTLDYLSSKEGA